MSRQWIAGRYAQALANAESSLRLSEQLPEGDERLRAELGARLLKARGVAPVTGSRCAKSWELRPTTSLARPLAKHAKRCDARSMLAEIYGWFTQGFDTGDLKEAKALLEELEN